MAMMELNKIYCCDCFDAMKQMESESVAMCLTDPPYGEFIGKMGYIKSGGQKIRGRLAYNTDFGTVLWDDRRPSGEIIDEIFRVSRNQVIFGGNFIADMLPPSRCWVVWDKRGSDRYTSDFADCELIWTSFDRPSRIIRHLWNGMLQEDMAHKEVRYHPTQKPLKLMKKLITMFTEEGDTILDPFLGSGTTAIACKLTKRNYIGYEINPSYAQIAELRLKEFDSQQQLR